MKKMFIMAISALALVACLPEDLNNTSDGDDSNDNGTGTSSLSADIELTYSSAAPGDYPLGIRAEVTATAGSEYVVKLGDEVIESGSMPPNPILQGPASGLTDGNNKRLVYFAIGEPGTKTVSVSITKNNETETASDTVTVGNVYEQNDNFYGSTLNPSDFNSCQGCHSPAPNTSSFCQFKNWDKVQNVSDPYRVANAPANTDPTPGSGMTGGEYSHSDGVKWTQDSAKHFRMLELVYRMRNDTGCS
jgi:hypothetical protein